MYPYKIMLADSNGQPQLWWEDAANLCSAINEANAEAWERTRLGYPDAECRLVVVERATEKVVYNTHPGCNLRDAIEDEQRQMACAKRRILTAAGAVEGLIDDPGEFLQAVIVWGEANGYEDDAALLRKDWMANYGGVK